MRRLDSLYTQRVMYHPSNTFKNSLARTSYCQPSRTVNDSSKVCKPCIPLNAGIYTPPSSNGGGGGSGRACLMDSDGDTRVCVDTVPPTDSDTIYFTTAGSERARISNTGVFMVGTTTPTPGKIAHFEGDVQITGLLDPTGVQYVEQVGPPAINPANKGLFYVDSASTGSYSNTPVYVDSNNVSHIVGSVISSSIPVVDNTIVRYDSTTGDLIQESSLILDDAAVISNPTGDIGLNPNGGLGDVNVTGSMTITNNLTVMGTTVSIDTENLLVKDNCIYLNNGYTMAAPLPGCLVVNYLPTSNSANVGGVAFTAGNGGPPTVETDGSYAWLPGDIIQVSTSNDVGNDGLFEVDSYAAGVITIRGVGGTPPTFDFFQRNFVTDPTVAGVITQVNVSVISSGPDGVWEVSNGDDNTGTMVFTDIGGINNTTLGSAGGTFSLVNAGVGPNLLNKGVTAGSGIAVVDNGTNLEFASTIWKEIGGTISPVSNTTKGLLCGDILTNTVSGSNSTVVGGTNNTVTSDNVSIAGGSINTIDSTHGFIGGGQSNTITGGLSNSHRGAILGGENNSISGSAFANNSIVGGDGNQITGGSNSATVGGTTNTVTSDNVSISGGSSNSIDSTHGFIGGGQSNTITGALLNSHRGAILGGENNSISGSAFANNSIVGGDGNQITGGSNSICSGVNARTSRNNTYVWSDSSGLTVSAGSDQYFIAASGGVTMYSNAARTTGVILASGTSSFAAVSDENKKDNIMILDHLDIMNRVDQIEVMRYNYKETDAAYECYGPTAQQWHKHFGTPNVKEPLIDDETLEQAIDPETKEPIFYERPAKNPLTIDMKDMSGINMSCIKALSILNKDLNARHDELKVNYANLIDHVRILEAHHNESYNDINDRLTRIEAKG